MLFECENSKGEKNGKGKEYNYDKNFIYDGEYLNGEKNGKGKEYNLDNNLLIFEGEYLNGKRKNGIERKYFDTRTFDCIKKVIVAGKLNKLRLN